MSDVGNVLRSRRGVLGLAAGGIGGAVALAAARRLGRPTERVVRITTGTSMSSGKPVFTGLAGILAANGWLEPELAKKGVSVQWVPIPGASTGP